MQEPIISILLPSFGAEQLLEKVFIPSLKHSVVNFELILRDNGKNGNIKKYENEKIKVIGNGENIGLNVGLNECASVAMGNYFFLCHDDMYLMPNWDIALLEAHKNIPAGQALLCSRSIEKSSHTPFHVLKDFGQTPEDFKEKELLEYFKTYYDRGIVSGNRMPFFLHRKLWDKMGGVDPNYFSYATDNDLFFTAYDVGVRRFWLVQESVVYHLSGRSNQQQNVDRDDFSPYRYLISKWKKYRVDANIDASEQRLVPWNLKVK